jgi:hypothetical protein
MKAIEASSRRQVARFDSMLDTACQTRSPGDWSCHQSAHVAHITTSTHAWLHARAQHCSEHSTPYCPEAFVLVQHAQTAIAARTIIMRRNAGRAVPPMQIMHQGASKGGISPCLVHPPARPVLALLQHARVAACPGSALLGTAVNRACNGAARARDGRLHPAPAMGAAQARDRRPRPGTALLVTAAMCARDRRIPRLAACFLRACYCAEDRTKT